MDDVSKPGENDVPDMAPMDFEFDFKDSPSLQDLDFRFPLDLQPEHNLGTSLNGEGKEDRRVLD